LCIAINFDFILCTAVYMCMCTATYFDFIFFVLLLIAMFYNWRCMYA